jgi:hypothetical protein
MSDEFDSRENYHFKNEFTKKEVVYRTGPHYAIQGLPFNYEIPRKIIPRINNKKIQIRLLLIKVEYYTSESKTTENETYKKWLDSIIEKHNKEINRLKAEALRIIEDAKDSKTKTLIESIFPLKSNRQVVPTNAITKYSASVNKGGTKKYKKKKRQTNRKRRH